MLYTKSSGDFFKEKLLTAMKKIEKLTQECVSAQNSLQPAGQIGISVIRKVENARETDVCIGTSTNFGYITSKSCCQVDEMFMFDLESSEEIKIEENSVWIEEHICFINTTELLRFDFPPLDDDKTQAGFLIDGIKIPLLSNQKFLKTLLSNVLFLLSIVPKEYLLRSNCKLKLKDVLKLPAL